jgi:hypothetical protein
LSSAIDSGCLWLSILKGNRLTQSHQRDKGARRTKSTGAAFGIPNTDKAGEVTRAKRRLGPIIVLRSEYVKSQIE